MARFPEVSGWFRLGRRELIRALAGLVALLPNSAWLAPSGRQSAELSAGLSDGNRGGQAGGVASVPALGPFLDTLLPADGSPSATQLGVDQQILEHMHSTPRLTRILTLGCAWLDQQAARHGAAGFALLDEAAREAVVAEAERSAPDALQRVFFAGMLDLAFRYYYAQPDSWGDLGYAGPPQPQGFPGFASAPARPPTSLLAPAARSGAGSASNRPPQVLNTAPGTGPGSAPDHTAAAASLHQPGSMPDRGPAGSAHLGTTR